MNERQYKFYNVFKIRMNVSTDTDDTQVNYRQSIQFLSNVSSHTHTF